MRCCERGKAAYIPATRCIAGASNKAIGKVGWSICTIVFRVHFIFNFFFYPITHYPPPPPRWFGARNRLGWAARTKGGQRKAPSLPHPGCFGQAFNPRVPLR